MTGRSQISKRDLERLSAYLDGALEQKEAARLEARLQDDPSLRHALTDLRETIQLVGLLPELRPPRNFTLTPDMVGIREPRRAYPVMRLATAVAGLAFLIVVGVDALTSTIASRGMAPMAAEQIVEEAEAPIANALERAEAPDEDLGMKEADQFFAQPGVAVEEEAPGITEMAEDVYKLAAPTASPVGEEQLATELEQERKEDTPAPAGTSPAEGALPPIVGEGGIALDEAGEPTPTLVEIPPAMPGPTIEPTAISFRPPAAPLLSPLQWLEVGLGGLAVLLAVITLWVRKRS